MTDLAPEDNERIHGRGLRRSAGADCWRNQRSVWHPWWSSIVEPNLTLARHAEAQDLLGAFALGAVDTEEAATVRGHLATCAACQAEMVSLWAMVDVLRETVEPLAPPPALRDRIAAVIMAERGSSPPVHAAAPATATFTAMPTMAPVERVSEPIRKLASFWSRATPWAAAAAILLLLSAGLLIWNLHLREQIATAQVLETIALAPTDAAPNASGQVTHLPDDNLLIVDARNLPPLESGQVYEVWLIDEDGVPAPAGVFDQPTDRHAMIADRGQYETLAITAEPGPLGTGAPTGEIVATASL
jgi:anti-sigma-K factor RskA